MPFTFERNDLSAVAADAIVVAANERLQITGGVGLTVALAAGLEELQAACDEIGFCPCGSAVATPAFGLRAKVVVHAVGPVWLGGGLGEADFLRSAYDAALECALSAGARSIALPLISAGTYGFPADVSLAVARESIRTFLNRHDDVDVRLVLYSRESVVAGMSAYLDIAEYVDDRYVDEHPAWGTTVLPGSGEIGELRLEGATLDLPRRRVPKSPTRNLPRRHDDASRAPSGGWDLPWQRSCPGMKPRRQGNPPTTRQPCPWQLLRPRPTLRPRSTPRAPPRPATCPRLAPRACPRPIPRACPLPTASVTRPSSPLC